MAATDTPRPPARAAQRVVEALTAYGVEYVFGVPGAKIDAVFDVLLTRPALGGVPPRAERGSRRGRDVHRRELATLVLHEITSAPNCAVAQVY
ncbi:MAG TPA: thiamine pyrophosphate-binding protein [Mycobacterium sp.]|nr:thiamine pyrophosphate-binding protein [Mycobacterium sp.]